MDMRAQLFRAKGYLVFKLDNRGSARRGIEFEGQIQHKMGSIEVEDQVTGVRWLAEKNLADPARVGIYGWSYGGYMSAMALAKAPDVFKAAGKHSPPHLYLCQGSDTNLALFLSLLPVAGAPVTTWDGYDTHYTERYMGLIEENREAYQNETSVVFNANRIKGKLFLIALLKLAVFSMTYGTFTVCADQIGYTWEKKKQ